jgi:glycosyltransferase involved in cell wall biosynthesis
MSAPLVSVVIPSFNHRPFVAEAMRSVLSQDVDLELIVVDDGSTDGSPGIIGAIRDERIRFMAQENRGAHAAIDRGLRAGSAPYLAILNSDDRFAPGRLARAVDALRGDPSLDLVGSHIALIDDRGVRLSVKHGFDDLDPWPVPNPSETFKADADLATALLMQNYWATTSNFVMPRATYERCGPFRPLRYCHDWDFALRVQLDGRAALLPDPLVEYRVHASNTIREDRAAMVYEICWTLAVHVPRYLARPGFWAAGRERRARQLLRSIHVYGCDRVLWNMTAQLAWGPPGSEDALLDPGDEARALYLADIVRVLEATPADQPHLPSALRRAVARLRATLRA